MKTCRRCGVEKDEQSFSRDKNRSDGRFPYCADCMREHKREWYEKNKARHRSKCQKYAAENGDKIRDARRKRYARDSFVREYNNNWNRQAPGRQTAKKARRRALEAKAEGSFTAAEFRALCGKYGHRCLCCGEQKPLTADHVVPLYKGGTNWIDNIQPLCLSCNQKKRTQVIDYRKAVA